MKLPTYRVMHGREAPGAACNSRLAWAILSVEVILSTPSRVYAAASTPLPLSQGRPDDHAAILSVLHRGGSPLSLSSKGSTDFAGVAPNRRRAWNFAIG